MVLPVVVGIAARAVGTRAIGRAAARAGYARTVARATRLARVARPARRQRPPVYRPRPASPRPRRAPPLRPRTTSPRPRRQSPARRSTPRINNVARVAAQVFRPGYSYRQSPTLRRGQRSSRRAWRYQPPISIRYQVSRRRAPTPAGFKNNYAQSGNPRTRWTGYNTVVWRYGNDAWYNAVIVGQPFQPKPSASSQVPGASTTSASLWVQNHPLNRGTYVYKAAKELPAGPDPAYLPKDSKVADPYVPLFQPAPTTPVFQPLPVNPSQLEPWRLPLTPQILPRYPGTSPGTRPRPLPSPRPRPRPGADVAPPRGFQITPAGRVRLIAKAPGHRNRPPRSREREKKIKARGAVAVALKWALKVTEGLDILDVLWDSIPEWVRDYHMDQRPPGSSKAAWKAKGLWKYLDWVDGPTAMRGILQNEAEDKAVGTVSRDAQSGIAESDRFRLNQFLGQRAGENPSVQVNKDVDLWIHGAPDKHASSVRVF